MTTHPQQHHHNLGYLTPEEVTKSNKPATTERVQTHSNIRKHSKQINICSAIDIVQTNST